MKYKMMEMFNFYSFFFYLKQRENQEEFLGVGIGLSGKMWDLGIGNIEKDPRN